MCDHVSGIIPVLVAWQISCVSPIEWECSLSVKSSQNSPTQQHGSFLFFDCLLPLKANHDLSHLHQLSYTHYHSVLENTAISLSVGAVEESGIISTGKEKQGNTGQVKVCIGRLSNQEEMGVIKAARRRKKTYGPTRLEPSKLLFMAINPILFSIGLIRENFFCCFGSLLFEK